MVVLNVFEGISMKASGPKNRKLHDKSMQYLIVWCLFLFPFTVNLHPLFSYEFIMLINCESNHFLSYVYIYIFTMAILYHVCFHEYFVNYTVTWMNKIHHDDHYCLIIIQPTFKITLPSFITVWTTIRISDIFLDRSGYNRGMFIRAGTRKFLQKIVLSIMSIVKY